jgi:peptidoglycan/LPS O-acetylase OafA/YrhL
MDAKKNMKVLNGYRGFLAISVTMNHLVGYLKTNIALGHWFIWNSIGYCSVPGFFFLSAFLLSYRLLSDFENVQSFKLCFLKILLYAVRRLFRIYFVFLAFWTIIHYAHPLFRGNYTNNYANYTDGFVLADLGANHLWTIPVEIKYYFYIPFLCFLVFKCGIKFGFQMWLPICIILEILIFFNGVAAIIPSGYPNYLGLHFIAQYQIFIHGTVFGIVYLKIKDKCETVFADFKWKIFINSLVVVMFITQFYVKTNRYGYFSTIFLMISLLFSDSSNPISKLFNTYLMKKCGQFSFGIYLLHPMIIQAYSEFKIESRFSITSFSEIVIGGFACSFLLGALWFYSVENFLIKSANIVCSKFESLTLFKKDCILIDTQNKHFFL